MEKKKDTTEILFYSYNASKYHPAIFTEIQEKVIAVEHDTHTIQSSQKMFYLVRFTFFIFTLSPSSVHFLVDISPYSVPGADQNNHINNNITIHLPNALGTHSCYTYKIET